MIKNWLKILLTILVILLPSLAIFGSNILWKSSDKDGKCVPFRPSGWVYASVWSLIVVCISVSWGLIIWQNNNSAIIITSILFVLILICTTFWQYVYHIPHKIEAIGVFIFLIFFVFANLIYTYKINIYSALLISPLFIWAIFQLVISSYELTC